MATSQHESSGRVLVEWVDKIDGWGNLGCLAVKVTIRVCEALAGGNEQVSAQRQVRGSFDLGKSRYSVTIVRSPPIDQRVFYFREG